MRKRIIILSLAILILLPMASAVHSSLNNHTVTTKTEIIQVEPDTNSVLRLALGYYVDKLNPVSSTTAYDWEIMGWLFDGYTWAHPYDYFNLASDIPWMLAEPPTWVVTYDNSLGYNISYWIFHFKSGIKFFDGVELNASDVKFTYDFIKWMGDAAEAWDFLARIIINATIIDTYTVKVFLNTTGIISARYALGIVFPKHIYEKATTWGGIEGDQDFPNWISVTQTKVKDYRAKSASDPILTGYGPFKLASWSPSDKPCTEASVFILERNGDYFMRAVDEAGNVVWDWHELTPEYVEQYGADALRGPYIKELRYKVIIEAADVVGSLLAGEIDMAADFAFGRYYNELISADFTLAYAPRLGFGHTIINVRNWPLNESAFRRALAYAYDKRAVCQTVWAGWAEPLDVPIPKSMGTWSIEYMTFKPDSHADHNEPKALSELQSIGIYNRDGDKWLEGPDGSEITINIMGTDTTDVRGIVETLAESVEKIGIHVERKYVDFRTLISQATSGQFEIAFFGFGLGRLPTFLEVFASWSYVWAGIVGYHNAEYDHLIEQAFYNESDMDTIRQYVWQAQLILFNELPIIPIYQNIIVGAYKSVKNFGTDGWAGVFEDLVGSPIVNGFTIMKAVKPKSYTIITTEEEVTTTTSVTGPVVVETESVFTTTAVPITVVQVVTQEAAPWLGVGIAINILALVAASLLVMRKPGE